jgi:hypothetical protein
VKLPALNNKKLIGFILSGALLATQSLFAYQPEKNFWSERRRAAQRGSSALLASLPQTVQGPTSLAAQFPSPQILRSSLSQSVVRSVPKTFLTSHADLLAALSPTNGNVRKVSLGKNAGSSGPVVIHIQDVHMNADAQKNIRETVAAMLKSGKVGLVALEGSTEDIALQPFVDFPNRKTVELTADYLLRENKISGPIHAAMTAQGKLPRILGIDDPAHYTANVQAYKDSAPKLEETRLAISKRRGDLEEQKKAVFSPALLALDQTVTGYRNDKVSLGDYVEAMVNTCSVVAPFMGRPFTKSFLQALKTERTLDFRQVEAERSRLIEKLTQTLNPQEINELMAQSLAYRTGELRYGDFYAHLKETCRKKGIPLSDYPAMDEYVRYVLLCDGIDAEQLLNEIASMEKSAYDALAKTPEEKALAAQSRQSWLTSKLVDFSLTPTEWQEYKTNKNGMNFPPPPAAHRRALGTWGAIGADAGEGGRSPGEGGGEETISNGKMIEVSNKNDLASFESFYREAESRDTAMAKNLLTALDLESKSGSATPPIALLVTGGFHANGMAQQLTEKGATVISYVPKIEKVDTAQGSAYLSIFTQEKTPLEKLFQGEKLFLASSPFSRNDRTTLVPALVTMLGVLLIGQMGGVDLDADYAALGGVGFLAGLKIVHETVRAKLIVYKKAVDVEVAIERNGNLRVAQSIKKEFFRLSAITAFLKSQFSRAERIHPRQLLRELIFLAPVFTQILLGWMIDPTMGPWALFLSSLTPLALTLPIFLLYHWNVFEDLLGKTPKDQSRERVAAVYFTFVSVGFLLFGVGSSGLFAFTLGAMTSGAVLSNIPWVGASLLASLGLAYGIHRTGNQKLSVPAMAKRKKPIGADTNIIALAERHFNSYPGNPPESELNRMEGIHHSYGRKNRIFIELLSVNRDIKDFLVDVLFKSKRTLSVEQTAALLGMWIDPRVSDEAVRLVLDNLDNREFGEMALSTLSRYSGMQMSALRGFLYELWVLTEINKHKLLGPNVEFAHGPREIRGVGVIGELDGKYITKDGHPIIVETRDRSSGLDYEIINGGLSSVKWDIWVKQRSVEVQEKCEKLSKMLRFRPDVFFGEGRPRDVSYVFVMPTIPGLSAEQQQELIGIFTTQRTVSMADGTQINFTTRSVSLPRVLLMDDKNGGTGIKVKMAGRPFLKDADTTLSSDDIRAIEWKKNEIAQLANRVNFIFADEKRELIWRFLSSYDIPPGFTQLLKDYVYGRTSMDRLTPEQRVFRLITLDRASLVRALVQASRDNLGLENILKEEFLATTARRNARPLSHRYILSQKTGMKNAINRLTDRLRNVQLQDNSIANKILDELWKGHAALVNSPDECLTSPTGPFSRMTTAVGDILTQAEVQSPKVGATLVDLMTDPFGDSYVDLMAQLNLQSDVLENSSYLVRERLQARAIKQESPSLPSPKITLPNGREEVICQMEANRFDWAVRELNFRLIFADLINVQEVKQIMSRLLQIDERFKKNPVVEFENHLNGGGATKMSEHVATQIAVLSERDPRMAQQVLDVFFSKTDSGSRPALDIGLDIWAIQLAELEFSVSSDLGPTSIERVISEISQLVETTQDRNNVPLRSLLYWIGKVDKSFKSKVVGAENLTTDMFYDFIQEVNEKILLPNGWWAALDLVGLRLVVFPVRIISKSEKIHSYLGENIYSEEFYSPNATITNPEFAIWNYSFFSPGASRYIERVGLAQLRKMQSRLASPFSIELAKLLNTSRLDEDLLIDALLTYNLGASLRSSMNTIFRKKMLGNIFASQGDWVNDMIVMRPDTFSSSTSNAPDQRVLTTFLGGAYLESNLMSLIQTMSSVGDKDPNLAYGLFLEWLPLYFDAHRIQRNAFDVVAQTDEFTDPHSIAAFMHFSRWEFNRSQLIAASYLLTDAMGIVVGQSKLSSVGMRADPKETITDLGITENNLKNYIDYRTHVTGKKRFLIVLELLKQVHALLFYSESERLGIVEQGVNNDLTDLLRHVKTAIIDPSTHADINSRIGQLPVPPGLQGGRLLTGKRRISKLVELLYDLNTETENGYLRERAVRLSAPNSDGKASGWLGYGFSFFIGFLLAVGSKVFQRETREIDIGAYAQSFANRHKESAEDILNALVSVTTGLVAGQKLDVLSWLSLGTLSPPLAIVFPIVFVISVWYTLFVASHLVAPKKLETITGENPSVLKSIRLFGSYLAPLIASALLGSALHDLWTPVIMVALYGFQLWTFPWVRARHNKVNLPSANPNSDFRNRRRILALFLLAFVPLGPVLASGLGVLAEEERYLPIYTRHAVSEDILPYVNGIKRTILKHAAEGRTIVFALENAAFDSKELAEAMMETPLDIKKWERLFHNNQLNFMGEGVSEELAGYFLNSETFDGEIWRLIVWAKDRGIKTKVVFEKPSFDSFESEVNNFRLISEARTAFIGGDFGGAVALLGKNFEFLKEMIKKRDYKYHGDLKRVLSEPSHFLVDFRGAGHHPLYNSSSDEKVANTEKGLTYFGITRLFLLDRIGQVSSEQERQRLMVSAIVSGNIEAYLQLRLGGYVGTIPAGGKRMEMLKTIVDNLSLEDFQAISTETGKAVERKQGYEWQVVGIVEIVDWLKRNNKIPPQYINYFQNQKTSQQAQNDGRATSQWGLKFVEWIGSKVDSEHGRERFGVEYWRFAAYIEWTFGAKVAFWGFVATVAFAGGPLGWAIAPAVGTVYGILFVASHFIVPESMTPVTKVNVGVVQAWTMGMIYGVLIGATPFLLGAVPLLGVPELGVQAAGVLWGLAGSLHFSFDKENSRKEGDQAAWKLIEQFSTVQRAFETVMPGIQNEHTEQIVGKGSVSTDGMTEMLSRLKTDREYRAGFVEAVQTTLGDPKLSGASMNLFSSMVMAATGQPIAYVHVLGNSPAQELQTLERLIEREGKTPSGFSVALVVSESQKTEFKTMIDVFEARGVAVFSVDIKEHGWSKEVLMGLDNKMSTFLAKANGIVATVGEKVGINLAVVEALGPESKLKAPLKNALTFGEVVEVFLRVLQALASNA